MELHEHSAGGHDPHSAPLPTALAAHGKLMADASRCDRQRSPSDLPRDLPCTRINHCVCCHTYFSTFLQNKHTRMKYSIVNLVSCQAPSNKHPMPSTFLISTFLQGTPHSVSARFRGMTTHFYLLFFFALSLQLFAISPDPVLSLPIKLRKVPTKVQNARKRRRISSLYLFLI